LESLLRARPPQTGKSYPKPPAPRPAERARPVSPRTFESFVPEYVDPPAFRDLPATAQSLSAALAVSPAIQNHVRNLPQGVFSNMDLQIEEVKFHGDTAEAFVRFQSPSVSELVIRQRYILRRSDEHWQVESRQPTNGEGKHPAHAVLPGPMPLRIS